MAANPYGPVTTTDPSHLTDDEWQLQLPPIKYKRYPGTDKLKSIIFEIRQNHKNLTLAIAGVCVVILVLMIIVLTVSRYPNKCPYPGASDYDHQWQSIDQGLNFYPVPEDKSVLIAFDPTDFNEIKAHPIKQSLNKVLANYSTINQINEHVYTDCNSTHSPLDKTCRVSRSMFGDMCTPERNYGYFGGQPCVFIQLNLPNGVFVKPIMRESPLWETAKMAMPKVSDASYVPVTCNGTTSKDKEKLSSVRGYGPKGEIIMYYPKQGIQSYIYRERNTELPFLKPGVMVQFTSLVSKNLIHVTCTAWGQLYNADGNLIDHNLLTTHFELFIKY